MISNIGLDKKLTFEQVEKSLLDLFPDYVIFREDPETGYPNDEMNWNRLDHVWVQIDFYEDRKDFKYFICIECGVKKKYDQKQSLHIARKISEDYNIRTLSEYSDEEFHELGMCILFDNGKTYLVDDYWDFPMVGEESAEGIRMLKEMEIPRYRFDSTGDYIGVLTD